MIEVGQIAYIIDHNVHGDPNGPLNEPKVYEARIIKHENGLYDGTWTQGYNLFKDTPEKLVHPTEKDANLYIKEHRDEIIRESFEKHKKWFNEQIKKARNL